MSGIGNYYVKYYGDSGSEGPDLDGNLWGYLNLASIGGGGLLACYETTSFTGLKTLIMLTGSDGIPLWTKTLHVPGLSPFKVSEWRPGSGRVRVGWTEVKSGYIEMTVGEISSAGTLTANIIQVHAQNDNSTNRSIGRNVCLSRNRAGFVGNNIIHLATLNNTVVPIGSVKLSGVIGTGGALAGVSDYGVVIDSAGYVINMSGIANSVAVRHLDIGANGGISPNGVFPTPDGGMIVVYNSSSTYIVKLTKAGAIQWQRKFTQVFGVNRVCPCADGTYLLSGYVGTVRHIARISNTGAMLWSRKRVANGYTNPSAAIIDTGMDVVTLWKGENAGNDAVIVRSPRDGAPSACQYFDTDAGLTNAVSTDAALRATGTVNVVAESTFAHSASAAVLTDVTQANRTITCFTPEVVPDSPPEFWPPNTGGDDDEDYPPIAWGGNPGGQPGGPGVPGDAGDASTKDGAFFVLEEYGSNPGIIGGWTCWRGLPARFGVWSPEQNRIELLGDGRVAFMPQRGRAYTNAEILFGFTHLSGESLAITAVLHFSLEFTGDGATLAVDFEVDGEWVNTVEKNTDLPEWYFARSVAAGVAVWSTDPADGCWVKPISQVKRFYAIGKNRGRLTRVRVRHEDQGSFRPQRAMITFAVRNLR